NPDERCPGDLRCGRCDLRPQDDHSRGCTWQGSRSFHARVSAQALTTGRVRDARRRIRDGIDPATREYRTSGPAPNTARGDATARAGCARSLYRVRGWFDGGAGPARGESLLTL